MKSAIFAIASIATAIAAQPIPAVTSCAPVTLTYTTAGETSATGCAHCDNHGDALYNSITNSASALSQTASSIISAINAVPTASSEASGSWNQTDGINLATNLASWVRDVPGIDNEFGIDGSLSPNLVCLSFLETRAYVGALADAVIQFRDLLENDQAFRAAFGDENYYTLATNWFNSVNNAITTKTNNIKLGAGCLDCDDVEALNAYIGDVNDVNDVFFHDTLKVGSLSTLDSDCGVITTTVTSDQCPVTSSANSTVPHSTIPHSANNTSTHSTASHSTNGIPHRTNTVVSTVVSTVPCSKCPGGYSTIVVTASSTAKSTSSAPAHSSQHLYASASASTAGQTKPSVVPAASGSSTVAQTNSASTLCFSSSLVLVMLSLYLL